LPRSPIFFSYSRKDLDFIHELYDDLEKHGANIWLDQRNIPDGAEWVVEIENALTNAEVILYVVSENSARSRNVRNEILYAIEEKKQLIPIKISNCKIPLFIRTYQYIDFSKDYPAGLKRLLATLNLFDDPAAMEVLDEDRKKSTSIKPQNRYNSDQEHYEGFKDPLWWASIPLVVTVSIACTYFASKLFTYLFEELNSKQLYYQSSWTLLIIIGAFWGLAYAIKTERNAPKRKYLLLGISMPFFNIFLPETFADIVQGLFTALFINTIYALLLSMGLAFIVHNVFELDSSITFLICFLGINTCALFGFIKEDFS